jgi:hypothetical protein
MALLTDPGCYSDSDSPPYGLCDPLILRHDLRLRFGCYMMCEDLGGRRLLFGCFFISTPITCPLPTLDEDWEVTNLHIEDVSETHEARWYRTFTMTLIRACRVVSIRRRRML